MGRPVDFPLKRSVSSRLLLQSYCSSAKWLHSHFGRCEAILELVTKLRSVQARASARLRRFCVVMAVVLLIT
eukprot:2927742-Pleurochrysis_carterae.AAC.1